MSKRQDLPEPGRWAREALWRFLFPNDEQQATALRRVLYEMLIYPRYDLATNENLAGQEANYRAALPAMVAELDRTELVAVVEVMRLLALVPRQPGLLRGRRARTGERFRGS